MKRISKFRLFALLLLVALGINALSNNRLIPDGFKPSEQPKNYLTGLPGTNGKVLAVKIDDTMEAHPQIGIEAADLVYVEQVESGLTRLLALYTSEYPEFIGPIRSARISDIDLLAQYGKVAFAYSGSQTKMRPVLAEANLNILSAERNPPSIFARDESRVSPVNMILYIEKLFQQATNKLKMSLISLPSSPWLFGENSKLATPVKSAKISWPNAKYEVIWNSESKCWNLIQNGSVEVTTSGSNLCIQNAIIQKVKIEPSIYGDKFGGITPISQTVGRGTAVLLRDGKYLNLNWQRDEATQYTNWFDKEGERMKITPGKTWVFLADTDPILTLQP
jgi:hypothetical protein